MFNHYYMQKYFNDLAQQSTDTLPAKYRTKIKNIVWTMLSKHAHTDDVYDVNKVFNLLQ